MAEFFGVRKPQPGRRFGQLTAGLVLFGVSLALLVRAAFGLDPWNVLNTGLALQSNLTIGQVSILIGIAIMLSWIPLRQKPRVGTVLNVFIIGLSLDAALSALPLVESLPLRGALFAGGLFLNGIANAAYIGAGLGVGPRDGLMTGLHQRFGWSIRVSRGLIEVSVLTVGWLLGGPVGLGTVAYAFAIGPIVQLSLVHLTIGRPAGQPEGEAT